MHVLILADFFILLIRWLENFDSDQQWTSFKKSKYWPMYDWQLSGKVYRELQWDLLMPGSSLPAGLGLGWPAPLTGWTARRRRGAVGGADRRGSSTASSTGSAGSPAWSSGPGLRCGRCTTTLAICNQAVSSFCHNFKCFHRVRVVHCALPIKLVP